MKRNKAIAKKMRSGVPPYTRAARSGEPKRPCTHCHEITERIKAAPSVMRYNETAGLYYMERDGI